MCFSPMSKSPSHLSAVHYHPFLPSPIFLNTPFPLQPASNQLIQGPILWTDSWNLKPRWEKNEERFIYPRTPDLSLGLCLIHSHLPPMSFQSQTRAKPYFPGNPTSPHLFFLPRHPAIGQLEAKDDGSLQGPSRWPWPRCSPRELLVS